MSRQSTEEAPRLRHNGINFKMFLKKHYKSQNTIQTPPCNTCVFKSCKRNKKKGTCSEFGWLSAFWPPSSVFSSLVLGGQGFAADLLTLIIILLWRFWVGLHVSAIEIFIGL